MTGKCNANQRYIYDKIKSIHQLFTSTINKYNISISIQQCEGHIWAPNDSADKLAKIAVDNEYGDYALITNPILFTKIKNIMNNKLISNTKILIDNDPTDHIISYNLSKVRVTSRLKMNYDQSVCVDQAYQ